MIFSRKAAFNILSIGLAAFVSQAAHAAGFDLAGDFSASNNPSGAWSYGWAGSLNGSFTPLTVQHISTVDGGAQIPSWQLTHTEAPVVYKNVSTNTLTAGGGVVIFDPSQVWFSPGQNGRPENYCVIRFTAPSNGLYRLETGVQPLYAGAPQGDTDFHVLKNGTELFGQFLAPADGASYSNTVALASGDTIDLAVGRGASGNQFGDGLKISATFVSASPQSPVCVPALGSIVGWWKLEGNADDALGQNGGELTGAPLFVSGEVGQGLNFDGANDRVRVAASSSINVGAGEGFTVEGWINPADMSQLRPIAEWNSGGIGAHFWAGVESTASLYANLVDTTGGFHVVQTPSGVLSTGVWQHVALSYDKASGQATIYHNGAVAAQVSLGSFNPLTTGDLYFGNRPSGPFSGIYWKGGMDEMSLYGRALRASDIQAIFNAGTAGKCSLPPPPVCVTAVAGLAGWWPLEGNANDSLGQNNGVLVGGPAFTGGQVGQGLSFDGANDLVRVAASSSINVGAGAGFTVEGWINPADLSQLRPIAEWNTGNIGAHFWASAESTGSLYANLVDTSGGFHTIQTPAGVLTAGVWQHVALSYDKASGQATFYHNGAMAAQASLGSFSSLTTGDLYFGNRPSGPFSGIYWKGGMDEMSLYGRALPASDIQAIFNAGSAGKCPLPPPPPVPAYNLSSDFSPTNNPNGSWSYGWAGRLNGSFTLLTVQHISTVDGGAQIPSWQLTHGEAPAVYKNISNSTLTAGGGQVSFAPGQVWFTPGQDGRPENYGVIRFTAPSNGLYQLVAAVQPLYDGPPQGDTDFHVLRNRTELFGQFLSPADSTSYSNVVGLAVGGTIDLAVGRGASGTQYGDGLKITAVLTPAGAWNPPPNSAPVAKATIEPLFKPWLDETNHLIIAPNGEDVVVLLDGSLSSDADGDALTYLWVKDAEPAPFAGGVAATNSFEVGSHSIELVVDDGQATGSELVSFEVITLTDAVDELLLVVADLDLRRKEKRELIATLESARESFERERLRAGAKKLQAFQQKLRARLASKDAPAVRRLIAAAEHIIDVVEEYLDQQEKYPRDDKGGGRNGRK